MAAPTINVSLPEHLYLRLQHAADATRQSLAEVLIRAVEVGSPPSWEDVPSAFQTELSAMDRLDDGALWRIAREDRTERDMQRWQELLDKNANATLTPEEQTEIVQLRTDGDRLTLRKAHAVAFVSDGAPR